MFSIALAHQLRCPPNVDLRYHAVKAARSRPAGGGRLTEEVAEELIA
jgi:hypothetical protein